jgi:hypothetical protein
MIGLFRESKPTLCRIYTSIARRADLSIARVIEALRLSLLIVPIFFSFPHMARAAVTETVEIETVEDEAPAPPVSPGIARFGPFSVKTPRIAVLDGETNAATPGEFRAMVAAYPQISQIEMIECPGTLDDDANLEVAQMIRSARISTHVPANGSVRSGGVELFLAGLHHTHDKGAEFGVHSWQDDEGHQARDYGANDPARAQYVRYYEQVGLPPAKAQAFYAFTAQIPFNRIHFLSEGELAQFGLSE